ncbi:MAG: ABC transporter permease [Candidatus Acidiferrales bacterium]
MGTLLQDLRYAVRMPKKNPGFTAIAVLTLALGIGANTSIFSFVNAWIINPLPYPNSDRLNIVQSLNTQQGSTSLGNTAADFYDWQRESKDFEELCAWTPQAFNLAGDGPPERAVGTLVTWNFFETLGARPLLGRTFLPSDDQSGAQRVVILSRGLWETRFAGDPHIVGRNIKVGGESYIVVGVMPANFQLPLTGESNLWTPLALSQKDHDDRNNSWLLVMGRRKPGVPMPSAQAEMSSIAAQLEKTYPKTNTHSGVLLESLKDAIGQNAGNEPVLILFWIVGFVLLIACANVANLMLARATGRAKELAVRSALGAGRYRLVRQLLTETVLLFIAGGAAGVFVGYWGLAWIDAAIPERSRGYLLNFGQVSLDLGTLAYVFCVALFAGILFGLAPALSGSKLDVNSTLKDAAGRATGSRAGSRLRSIFVVAEVALAVVIVICSSLLIRSFVGMVRTSPGFQPENALVTDLSLPEAKYKTPAEIKAFYDQVLERVRAIPQVAAVGASMQIPFDLCCQTLEVTVVGRPAPNPGEVPGARYSVVTPDYFNTMQISLLKGRAFTSADGPSVPPVVIINQELARQFWANENPIGQKIHISPDPDVDATIVGVVADVKVNSLMNYHRDREMYVPFAQFPSRGMGIVVRSTANRATLADAIRNSIWSVDAEQPVSQIRLFKTIVADEYGGYQVVSELMGFFSVLGLFLGAIGIYGVMAFMVTQRTHEIGIRLTLGAQPREILRLVVGKGLALAGIGIAVGVVGALAMTRLLAFMLAGVSPRDPLTFTGVALLIAAVALAACYIPARRAMRVDPMVALRYE